MKRLLALSLFALALAVPSHAQSQTITFSGSGSGDTIQYENGVFIPPGYVFLPFQSSGFVTPDGGMSIYLPDETLEISPTYANGMETDPVRGVKTNVTYFPAPNQTQIKTYSETDTFTFYAWSGSVAQNFQYFDTGKYSCMRYRCSKVYRLVLMDFNGTMTNNLQ